MAVDLFVQNVPEDLVARLQERAARFHRFLQDELLTILDLAVTEKRRLTLTPKASASAQRVLTSSDPFSST